MQPLERVIMWQLLKGGLCSYYELIHHLYGNDPDGGPDNPRSVIDVRICSVRKECPIPIETRWGVGYLVENQYIGRLHEWLVDELIHDLIKKENKRERDQRQPHEANGVAGT